VTAGIIGGLTLYTFHATKQGVEFTWMAPMLWAALWGMLLWGIIQLFFPPSHLINSVYSLMGALLFSFYIVFDTHLLIKHMPPDEYIWAATKLYLDCVNLFMYILNLLGNNRRD
jgi:protein lifeguard